MTLIKIPCPRCGGTGLIRRKDPSGHGDTDTICCPACNHDPYGSGYGTPETAGWIMAPEEVVEAMDRKKREIEVECDGCKGEGKVRRSAVSSSEGVIGHTIVPCRKCNGKGTTTALLPKKKGPGSE